MDVAYDEWGPLAGLIGTWESDYDGLDVSFHNEHGKVEETPYREATSFAPFGPVGRGAQRLYGLDYRTAIFRRDQEHPFHSEVGYWMWDGVAGELVRCFVMARGQACLAGATVAPDATTFTLHAELGSNTYGILSNLYLDAVAHTTRFDATITVLGDSYRYAQTTIVEHKQHPTVILHTDRNTLTRVSREG